MNTTTQNIASVAEPLFCKDCRYVSGDRTPQCNATGALLVDLVRGYVTQFCQSARLPGGRCGPAADLFEATTKPAYYRAPYASLSSLSPDDELPLLSERNRASAVNSTNTVATTAAGTSAPNTDSHIDRAVTKRS